MRTCTSKYLEDAALGLKTFRTQKGAKGDSRSILPRARAFSDSFLPFSHEKWSEHRTTFTNGSYDARFVFREIFLKEIHSRTLI